MAHPPERREAGKAYQAVRRSPSNTNNSKARITTQIIKRRTFSFGMPACNHGLAEAPFTDPAAFLTDDCVDEDEEGMGEGGREEGQCVAQIIVRLEPHLNKCEKDSRQYNCMNMCEKRKERRRKPSVHAHGWRQCFRCDLRARATLPQTSPPPPTPTMSLLLAHTK